MANKIHTEDFESCVADVMKQGHEKGSAFAICTKSFQDAGKPIFVESFSWAGSIKPVEGTHNLIRGKAIHPMVTVHPLEWPVYRVYLHEELSKAASTLKGKPLLLDHKEKLNGEVLDAQWEDDAVEYVAMLNDLDVYEKVRNRDIKHASVEYLWRSLDNVNGFAPRGINFVALSLLEKEQPGDPASSVEVWEKIIREMKVRMKEQGEAQEFILHQIRDAAGFLEDGFSTVWIDPNLGIQAIFGRPKDNPEQSHPVALFFLKAKNWDLPKMQEWLRLHPEYVRQQPTQAVGVSVSPSPPQTEVKILEKKNTLEERVETIERQIRKILNQNKLQEAEWDTAYINNLDDNAFAVISKGGEKDEQGKTSPRTLRHLPHHNAQGDLDLAHLRNALARLPQTDLSAEDRGEAKRHLCGHAKESEIISEVCGEEPQEETLKELIETRKKLVDAEAKIVDVEKQLREIKEAKQQFIEKVESVIPADFIWKSWGMSGGSRLVMDLKKVLRENSA